jgi:hypothetical protein
MAKMSSSTFSRHFFDVTAAVDELLDMLARPVGVDKTKEAACPLVLKMKSAAARSK